MKADSDSFESAFFMVFYYVSMFLKDIFYNHLGVVHMSHGAFAHWFLKKVLLRMGLLFKQRMSEDFFAIEMCGPINSMAGFRSEL